MEKLIQILFVNFQSLEHLSMMQIFLGFFTYMFYVFGTFLIILCFSWRLYSIPVKFSSNFGKKILIFLLFLMLISVFLFVFSWNMRYSTISQLVTIFTDMQRYDDGFYEFYDIIGNIFSIIMYFVFGFLLYKVYRNLVNNTYTKGKILISSLLILLISILTFASVLMWFAGIAGICGNNCSGAGKIISNLFLGYYGAIIVIIVLIYINFRIWSTKHISCDIKNSIKNP